MCVHQWWHLYQTDEKHLKLMKFCDIFTFYFVGVQQLCQI